MLGDRLIHISEGLRMLTRAWRVKFHGVRRLGNKWDKICKAVIDRSFSNGYFHTSSGHFSEFYVRDFAWVIEPLINLGYAKEVQSTITYFMDVFVNYNRVTTTINPKGRPFDFPVNAPDSLAYVVYILHTVDTTLGTSYLSDYKHFLNRQLNDYYHTFVQPSTGLVKPFSHCSSMKDHAIRSSSCYDNCMLGMLSSLLNQYDFLVNPLKNYDYAGLLSRNFWTGSYFRDDLYKHAFASGDANVFPFWTGLITDKKMMRTAFSSLQLLHLDRPYPLKYSNNSVIELIKDATFANRYELNTSWMHLAIIYLSLLPVVDKERAKKDIISLQHLIEELGTFPEVIDTDGKPYESFFYVSDEGMIWAARFLWLAKKYKVIT